jgi:hypothetical protein
MPKAAIAPMPFSQEKLNDIFKISSKYLDRLISRESSDLEFKKAFGWNSLSKYLKTCAAFANAKGGYIVFGISDRPHRLVGLDATGLKLFESIQPEKMTEHFNRHFSPEIFWDMQEYELNGKTYGLFYIHESQNKPVVCIKDAETMIKESDIFYRYRGRSERIKYPELKSILDQKREREQRLWMQHLLRIAKIGVRDIGIFNLHTGEVTGTHGAFIIDESLLSQLSFIKEGEFSEAKGKPALKLIGNVEAVSHLPSLTTAKRIVKTKGIRVSDIVIAFLNQEKIDEPKEFIRQICFETTAFLPVYYFMSLAGIDNYQAIKLVNSTISRARARAKLAERLEKQTTQKLELPQQDNESSKKKGLFLLQIEMESVDQSLAGKDLDYCLQAIRSLPEDLIKSQLEYLSKLLRTWFDRHYASAEGSLANNLRRAICWIDEAVYRKSGS